MNVTTGRQRTNPFVTGGVYGVLFVLGAVQGMIGSFQYSRTAGSVPLAALVSCAVILATCLLAGWAMRSVSGALVPGVGGILAAFGLALPGSDGSVLIANSSPGTGYLHGGTASVGRGVGLSCGGSVRAAGPQ